MDHDLEALVQPLFLPLSPHAARLRNETRKANIFLRGWNLGAGENVSTLFFAIIFSPRKRCFWFRRTSPHSSQAPNLFLHSHPSAPQPISILSLRTAIHDTPLRAAKLAAVHAGALLRVVVVLGVGGRTLWSSLIK